MPWLLVVAACGAPPHAAPQRDETTDDPPTRPTAETPRAVGSTRHMDPAVARAFEINGQFAALPEPEPGDWLAFHPEEPQSAAAYAASVPNLPRPPRDTIVVVALSDLDPTRGPSLDALVDYAHRFFDLPVRVLDGVTVDELNPGRRTHHGASQLNAADVLDALEERIPDDAYCVIALTNEDLYPAEDFNYVFGLARLRARVGVFSFARYQSDDRAVAVQRAFKIMTHEVGHMFGITHCTHYACNMNGSNHLEELDREPMHLCPVCLRKLHMATGFDPASRYRALGHVYQREGLRRDAVWIEDRLQHLAGE